MIVTLTEQEVRDILTAVSEARNELCVGENFPEATAYENRLEAIAHKLKSSD